MLQLNEIVIDIERVFFCLNIEKIFQFKINENKNLVYLQISLLRSAAWLLRDALGVLG